MATETTPKDKLAQAIELALISPNELDSNWEPANIVDVIGKLARSIHELAEAIKGNNNGVQNSTD